MTEGQKQALLDLSEIERFSNCTFSIVQLKNPSKLTDDLKLDTSFDTSHLNHVTEGINFRARERFHILIHPDFPYKIPIVLTPHTRFASYPHVQWGRQLCLYQAPDVEWNPNDGMFGFMERLSNWLEKASLDQLDPIGGPLHPPVTYVGTAPYYYVIPHVNTPKVEHGPWIGFAQLNIVHEHRVDLVNWIEVLDEQPDHEIALCVLLDQPMPFEFPSRIIDLFNTLNSRGISFQQIYTFLQYTSIHNNDGSPLYMIVGTPMRGIRGSGELKQHLTAWRIEPSYATGLRNICLKNSQNDKYRKIGRQFEDAIYNWATTANISWCRVLENRSEIITRRDHMSPMAVFQGKTIAIWGCGALGSNLAIHLARAGVGKLILYDNDIVTPGILIRQPYNDADIGRSKSQSLADKIRAIRPNTLNLEVEEMESNIIVCSLSTNDWSSDADIIFDCTASRSVRTKLEQVRKDYPQIKAIVVSMMINSIATHGLMVIAMKDHTGGVADVYRRAKIDVCHDNSLSHFAESFYPHQPDEDFFQPEPGCSSPTFIGSSSDVSALSAQLLNLSAKHLSQYHNKNNKENDITAWAHYISPPHPISKINSYQKPFVEYSYLPDMVTLDKNHGYEIRTSLRAWEQMQNWIAKSRKTNGVDAETGGLLFGEINDAVKVIWITEVSGPPADSIARSDRFICGTDGTHQTTKYKQMRSRGSITYVGMWHTHPQSTPDPSEVDLQGVKKILSESGFSPRRVLLSIVGILHEQPKLGTHVFYRNDFSEPQTNYDPHRTQRHSPPVSKPIASLRQPEIGLALSGGGFRAIAFHLGCLRALNRAGILDQIGVISAVSGGAILAAMYSYSKDDFNRFDQRVCALLRKGLHRDILLALFNPAHIFKLILTILIAGPSAKISQLASFIATGFQNFMKSNRLNRSSIQFDPPFLRWASRTTTLESVLRNKLFGDAVINKPCRHGLDLVINATELRTGTAFRFGNHVSSCWRYGSILDDISVATAVAASAAYPLFLPALHKRYRFILNGKISKKRVILTDGGVYDNLGTSCLDPSRNPNYTSHYYSCERIICCKADDGQWDGANIQYGWISRMKCSVKALLRKSQDRLSSNLFHQRASGQLKGFVFPYLGIQDNSLREDPKVATLPEDFVTRSQVIGYPTDFRAMNEDDLEILTKRGEQLTNLLLDAYW